jgi:hypothetical protein
MCVVLNNNISQNVCDFQQIWLVCYQIASLVFLNMGQGLKVPAYGLVGCCDGKSNWVFCCKGYFVIERFLGINI